MYLSPVPLNGQINFIVESRSSGGAGISADSPPSFKIFDGGLNPIGIGGTTVAFFSYSGAYRGVVTPTAVQNFQRGQTYTIVAAWNISGSPRTQVFTFNVT